MVAFAFALASVTPAAPTPQGGPAVEPAANAPAATASLTSPEAVNRDSRAASCPQSQLLRQAAASTAGT